MELKGYLSRSQSLKALILFLLPRQPFLFMIGSDGGSSGNCFWISGLPLHFHPPPDSCRQRRGQRKGKTVISTGCI